MGRHAGFLTASSALARKYQDDGPHLIYLPERSFDIESFTADVQSVYDKLGRCVIAVSEGIHDENDIPIVTKMAKNVEHDAHGNVQLSGTGALADLLTDSIKKQTSISRVRGDTFGYLQRSFLGCVSEIDELEAREVGVKAVQFASKAGRNGTVTINRVQEYAVEYNLSALEDVAGKTKTMDDGMIAASGTDVTQTFVNYARPLLGKRMPVAYRLESPKVKKI